MKLSPEIFLHRQNVNSNMSNDGIEIDVRSSVDGLVLNHDRLDHSAEYPLLKDSLHLFAGKKIILNVKESGIEEELIQLMSGLDYYFLDSQIPDILKLSKYFTHIKSRFIIRISDVEPLSFKLLNLVNPTYIWLDYSNFANFDSTSYRDYILSIYDDLRIRTHKIILVSPELYSLEYLPLLDEVKKTIRSPWFSDFGVCTKYPEHWRN